MLYYKIVKYYYLITCIINFQIYFGKENMKIGYVNTVSIIFKITNMKNGRISKYTEKQS